MANRMFMWITDGQSNRQLSTDKQPPAGWKRGRIISTPKKQIKCQQCSSIFVSTVSKRGDDGIIRCPPCSRRKAQKKHQPKQRNKYLQETYGITLDQYDELLENQQGVCAICKQPETIRNERNDGFRLLCVDHDHESGKVRGLLCTDCNLGIGRFSDNRTLVRSAMSYLIKHSSIPSWDEYFMDLSYMASTRSKDPSTKVGAIIVRDKKIISTGYNGLPQPLDDNNQKFWERPEKYIVVIHAEQNAIIQAQGTNLRDATLYSTLYPCTECAKVIIQSGIKEVVFAYDANPRYKESFAKAQKLFDECGVAIRKFSV